jgi:hypothetical protein
MFSANFAGCLPEGDGPLPTFDTAAEAWNYLLEELGDDRWTPDDEDDPDGPQSMTRTALLMERMEADDRPGTCHTVDGIYEVEVVEDEDEVEALLDEVTGGDRPATQNEYAEVLEEISAPKMDRAANLMAMLKLSEGKVRRVIEHTSTPVGKIKNF